MKIEKEERLDKIKDSLLKDINRILVEAGEPWHGYLSVSDLFRLDWRYCGLGALSSAFHMCSFYLYDAVVVSKSVRDELMKALLDAEKQIMEEFPLYETRLNHNLFETQK